MNASRTDTAVLDKTLKILSGIRGVREVFVLTDQMRSELERIERGYPSLGPLKIVNDGVAACLKREHVVCIIKDKTFRAPPQATVVLVDEDGVVLGRELLPGETLPKTGPESKAIMLGNDFAIFHGKGGGRGARFVLPPIGFQELEHAEGVRSVCSSSPSTTGDFYLRKAARLKDDPKLASIIVGFDLARR